MRAPASGCGDSRGLRADVGGDRKRRANCRRLSRGASEGLGRGESGLEDDRRTGGSAGFETCCTGSGDRAGEIEFFGAQHRTLMAIVEETKLVANAAGRMVPTLANGKTQTPYLGVDQYKPQGNKTGPPIRSASDYP